jgi:hypothetical protein
MQIEKNSLGAFYNITISKGFMEYEIARRQLALKDHHIHSWFTHIRKLLQMYNLPTAYDMMGNPPTKHQWKQLLNKAFEEHLHTEWHNDINDKPSLKYLALPKYLNKQSHQLWHSVPNNIRAVTKANIRAKLITGIYTLQANGAKFNQHSVSSTLHLMQIRE